MDANADYINSLHQLKQKLTVQRLQNEVLETMIAKEQKLRLEAELKTHHATRQLIEAQVSINQLVDQVNWLHLQIKDVTYVSSPNYTKPC